MICNYTGFGNKKFFTKASVKFLSSVYEISDTPKRPYNRSEFAYLFLATSPTVYNTFKLFKLVFVSDSYQISRFS